MYNVCMYARVVQRSKALHLSARGVTTDSLVQIRVVSQPAVIRSPIERRQLAQLHLGLAGVGHYCK
jgi:hypothetical protein